MCGGGEGGVWGDSVSCEKVQKNGRCYTIHTHIYIYTTSNSVWCVCVFVCV